MDWATGGSRDTQYLPGSAVGDSERDCRAPILRAYTTHEDVSFADIPPETATVNLFDKGNKVHLLTSDNGSNHANIDSATVDPDA